MAGKIFAILSPEEDPRLELRILQTYPEAYQYSDTMHLIAANTTAAVVARRLQLDGKDEDGRPAVGAIIAINEDYAGFADASL